MDSCPGLFNEGTDSIPLLADLSGPGGAVVLDQVLKVWRWHTFGCFVVLMIAFRAGPLIVFKSKSDWFLIG